MGGHPNFKILVAKTWCVAENNHQYATSMFPRKVREWNKHIFGNTFTRKKDILAHLDETQKNINSFPNPTLFDHENRLKNEYLGILNLEEKLWATKLRTTSISDGDRNTKYYHVTTLVRRSKARV